MRPAIRPARPSFAQELHGLEASSAAHVRTRAAPSLAWLPSGGNSSAPTGLPTPAARLAYRDDSDVAPSGRAISHETTLAQLAELLCATPLSYGRLRQLRRAFARAHHPDRCQPAERAAATALMQAANAMIDARSAACSIRSTNRRRNTADGQR